MVKNLIYKDIMKEIEWFRYRHHIFDVLQDCFSMYATAISNQFDFANYRAREDNYLQLIKKYDKEEQEKICSIFGKIVLLCQIENGDYDDYLGKLYMQSETSSKMHGQFFTPYEVSQLMARLLIDNYDLTKDVIVINDPCCGAGGLLIAMVDEISKKGVSIKDKVLVVAQDIDSRCVNMSYIQFALMGIPAVVMKGDTLAYKFTEIWKTPAFFQNYAKFEKVWQSLDR